MQPRRKDAALLEAVSDHKSFVSLLLEHGADWKCPSYQRASQLGPHVNPLLSGKRADAITGSPFAVAFGNVFDLTAALC